MITEWLLGLGQTVVTWFASLFPPADEMPDFLRDLDSTISGLLSNLSGIGAWVDWAYIIVIVLAVAGLWLVAFGIKVLRALIAHLPLIGGKG